ncbi:Glycosyltransferase involved in cell wall bisynthesis [Thermoflavifilum thermophilum]|uniref:Glycosyltransferase involved in cell wall bisynthesis n=2 Tax=Thermoflavifilum thermophilum TaxID=1393122 RepID=A0A1I7N9M7_9BACT|nr:Glycosyltransferase involved in cell wall bisynthesis [Thermoflavifilum thermophilum]
MHKAMCRRLAVVITHPIQYYAPLFRLLSQHSGVQLKVFYTWSQTQHRIFDIGFRQEVAWDIPLLEGYDYTFIPNVSRKPGCHHFMGIRNPSLIPAIEQWKPDALLVFGWNYWSHLQVMRTFKHRIPIYFRGDSTLIDEQLGMRKLMRRLFLRWVYRHIDFALYVGQHNRDYFLAHGLKASQLIYAPHAVDNERFADPDGEYATQAMSWRAQLSISREACVFLFAGKLIPKKNPLLLLQAFQDLQPTNAHLLYVGNGELEHALKQRVSGHSWLSSHVHFLPFQNQSRMPVVYRLGDVMVLPSSYNETWGLAVNEAMACGRPIIVSNRVGCAPDLVQPGVTGWIFEAGNKDELKEILRQVVDMHQQIPEQLQQIGMQAYQYIQNFSFNQLQNIIAKITPEYHEA